MAAASHWVNGLTIIDCTQCKRPQPFKTFVIMELIDKSVVIAEIERRISNHNKELQHASDEDFVSSWASDEENQKLALTALIPFLNTLEVKEVDLEKEIELIKGDYEQVDVAWNNDFDYIAKHFFELGIKSKGE